MSNTENSENKKQTKTFVFSPKTDITVYELAKIFEIANMSLDEDLYRNLENRVRRHFK